MVSHPFDNKKSKGWGTVLQFPFHKPCLSQRATYNFATIGSWQFEIAHEHSGNHQRAGGDGRPVRLGQFAPGVHAWSEHLVHRIDFESLIMHGMLPLLLFAGAFLLDLEHLQRERLPVALLSVLGTLVSFLAVAGLMILLSGTGAPWMECLIFGALISPTDPVAVLELLRRVGIPKAVEAQLAGESLFNDGIGAVLFVTMIEIARGQAPTPWHIAGMLCLKAGGAMILGVVAARIVSRLMCMVDAYQIEILLTLALALGGYVLADIWHLSAPLEAVVAGIALRQFNRRQPKGRIADDRVDQFWTMLDEGQNSLLFVLLGLEAMVVTLNATTIRAGLAAIVSVNLVRFVVVLLCLGIVRLFQRDRRSYCPRALSASDSGRYADGVVDLWRNLHDRRILDHSAGRLVAVCAVAYATTVRDNPSSRFLIRSTPVPGGFHDDSIRRPARALLHQMHCKDTPWGGYLHFSGRKYQKINQISAKY